jgi:hypothetical protein
MHRQVYVVPVHLPATCAHAQPDADTGLSPRSSLSFLFSLQLKKLSSVSIRANSNRPLDLVLGPLSTKVGTLNQPVWFHDHTFAA